MNEDGLALLEVTQDDQLEVGCNPGLRNCSTLLPAESLGKGHYVSLWHSCLLCIAAYATGFQDTTQQSAQRHAQTLLQAGAELLAVIAKAAKGLACMPINVSMLPDDAMRSELPCRKAEVISCWLCCPMLQVCECVQIV